MAPESLQCHLLPRETGISQVAAHPSRHLEQLSSGRQGRTGTGYGDLPDTKERDPHAWEKLDAMRPGDKKRKDEVQ